MDVNAQGVAESKETRRIEEEMAASVESPEQIQAKVSQQFVVHFPTCYSENLLMRTCL